MATSHHLLLQQNLEWFDILAPAYLGCPGNSLLKRMSLLVDFIGISLSVS